MIYSRITLLIAQNRLRDAENEIRAALTDDIDDGQLHQMLASVLRRQGKTKQALEAASRAIELVPDSDVSHFELSAALLERKNLKAALKSADEAIRLDPEDATNFGLKSRILTEMSRNDEALKAADRGLELDPEQDTCRFYRSVLLGVMGREDAANEASKDLLGDEPDDSSSHNARGWVMLHAGDGVTAERHFIEALRLDPMNDDARSGLAEALKLQNPLVGAFLKSIMWLSRISIWLVLICVVVVARIGNLLAAMDTPLTNVAAIGLDVLFYGFMLLILGGSVIFDLTLFTSSKGRMALTPLKIQFLQLALLPIVIAMVYFVWWIARGGPSAPYHALGWAGLAIVIHEAAEYELQWVRVRVLAVAGVLLLILLWVEFAEYAILWPASIRFAEAMPEIEPGDEIPEDARKQLAEQVQELATRRKNLAAYPALFVMLIGCFRDEIAEWLLRRAPDD